jgi:hypothetical protein
MAAIQVSPDYLVQFVEERLICKHTLRRGFASDRLARLDD